MDYKSLFCRKFIPVNAYVLRLPFTVIWHKNMNSKNDIYHHHKVSLGKLLKENGLEIMSKDFEVIDRIFNLLTEHKNIDKIEGLISTTQIVKYGSDIEDSKVKNIFYQIHNWYETITL